MRKIEPGLSIVIVKRADRSENPNDRPPTFGTSAISSTDWARSRGVAAVPFADGLYLSDLAAEFLHVLICLRYETTFPSEFAGAEAQGLLQPGNC